MNRDPDQPTVRMAPARRIHAPLATLVAALAGRVTHTEPHRVFTTLARHPKLFRRWLPIGDALLLHGELPRADTELLVLRTAHNCGCWYEWVQHAEIARHNGLSSDQVAAVADWPAYPHWSPRQLELLRAADELHRDRVISDSAWWPLAALLSERELVEVCMVVGHYAMLAGTLNSLGVRPEPAALRALDRASAGIAETLRLALVETRAPARADRPTVHSGHQGDGESTAT